MLGNNKISYSFFCKIHPFWVLKLSEKDREACLYKIHDNLRLKLNAAYNAEMYDTKDMDILVKRICNDSKKCMYRECPEFKDKELDSNILCEEGEQISSKVWRTKRMEINSKKSTETE